jgi:SAM-dependent methyltransferase
LHLTHTCPSCGSSATSAFYQIEDVPVHSVMLLHTREQALTYPRGVIELALCSDCGFVFNAAFDPSLQHYAPGYEATQSFSPTFNAFAHRLAAHLVQRYDLHHKNIIEIGCGQGEFLSLLCELGDNRGVGFDPAYVARPDEDLLYDQVTIVADVYSEEYSQVSADFVCCKMTLEHIPETAEFVRTVRASLGDASGATVFFQVPDVTRILRDTAYWDIYYEHCSYFSPGSLARLFRACGFDVLEVAREYDDQYLLLEARTGDGTAGQPLPVEETPVTLSQHVRHFRQRLDQTLTSWRKRLRQWHQAGDRVVIWGAGSKGVAFLTTLGIKDEIQYAVDVNPRKHGTFMAGTGQEIVSPVLLADYDPDIVIIMNPIYQQEIREALERLGISPRLVTV